MPPLTRVGLPAETSLSLTCHRCRNIRDSLKLVAANVPRSRHAIFIGSAEDFPFVAELKDNRRFVRCYAHGGFSVVVQIQPSEFGLAHQPRGVALPAISTRQGCPALLMYNDSEPNREESDQDMTGAEREGLIQLTSYDDMPWQVPTLFPQTASGCLLKLLRFDEKTDAMTFLYSMTPGFQQDNISYHDCAEEAYHIWDTSWMMQFGDLPTGGYFWRPAYINHGAFYSEHGILGFGRTDGELHNHFHWNPYSSPAEHADRAASWLIRQKPQLGKWRWSQDHNHIEFEHPADAYSVTSRDDRIHSHIDAEFHKHGIAHEHDHDHRKRK